MTFVFVRMEKVQISKQNNVKRVKILIVQIVFIIHINVYIVNHFGDWSKVIGIVYLVLCQNAKIVQQIILTVINALMDIMLTIILPIHNVSLVEYKIAQNALSLQIHAYNVLKVSK